jgi:hypothetical protein
MLFLIFVTSFDDQGNHFTISSNTFARGPKLSPGTHL